MGTPKIRGAKLLLRHPPRTLAQSLGEQATYDRHRAYSYSLSCVVVTCCCDECRRAKPYDDDHGAGERGKGERHLRCRLETTAPVATIPRTARPRNDWPGPPATTMPSTLMASEEPNHASPNAMRGNPGPAARDPGEIASLISASSRIVRSKQLNFADGRSNGQSFGEFRQHRSRDISVDNKGEESTPGGPHTRPGQDRAIATTVAVPLKWLRADQSPNPPQGFAARNTAGDGRPTGA
jgi:hypothetical protein